MPKTIIVFFGPPVSGKGTQAEMLAQKTGWKKITPGDLLRAEIAAGTETGKIAEKYIKAGKLVPDAMAAGLVAKHLKSKSSGFIFDGFPRNKKQSDELSRMLEKILKKNDKIFALEIAVSDSEVKRRITQRRMCSCGKVYHLAYNPPINDGLCDICGNKLFIRNDDKPHVIARRLKVYHRDSAPLIAPWRKQGKLIQIDGEQPIRKIHEEIMLRIDELRFNPYNTLHDNHKK